MRKSVRSKKKIHSRSASGFFVFPVSKHVVISIFAFTDARLIALIKVFFFWGVSAVDIR
jgi:hypothetical protein